MLVSEFDFELPPELIAREPRPRGTSRLLVADRRRGSIEEHSIRELPTLLSPGDRLVANDTRVFPARLVGRREPGGGMAECFLVAPLGDGEWEALVKPGQKLRPGARLVFEDSGRAPGVRIEAEVQEREPFGRRRVRFVVRGAESLEAAVDAIGRVPLPPYLQREDRPEDRDRYQTVYARERGSIAAPTAGLHFDPALINDLASAGVGWTTITLHVGYGTFKPVRVERVDDHQMDSEAFWISARASADIAATRAAGGRIVAVGTTSTRALESAAQVDGTVLAGAARTSLFIRPADSAHAGEGCRFKVVDALLTNFHLPRSSLFMLVSAFAGRELARDAYAYAIAKSFRFYSYGDAMLIL